MPPRFNFMGVSMAHFNLEFPRDIAAGCQAIISRRSEVVTLANGREEVNQRWAHSRRSWAAGLGIRSADDLAEVVALFEAVRGRANSFRFRDWSDWRSAPLRRGISATDQRIGAGDAVRVDFQLVKRYGAVNAYAREIQLPHAASVLVAVDGAPLSGGWSLLPHGVIRFDAPPAAGARVTAGFTFDCAARFDEDSLSVEWAYFAEDRGAASAPNIPLIEVRL